MRNEFELSCDIIKGTKKHPLIEFMTVCEAFSFEGIYYYNFEFYFLAKICYN